MTQHGRQEFTAEYLHIKDGDYEVIARNVKIELADFFDRGGVAAIIGQFTRTAHAKVETRGATMNGVPCDSPPTSSGLRELMAPR